MRRWHHPLILKIGGVVASERLLWWLWHHLCVAPQWSGGGLFNSLPPQDVAGNHPNFHLLGFRASALNSQPQDIHSEGRWLELGNPSIQLIFFGWLHSSGIRQPTIHPQLGFAADWNYTCQTMWTPDTKLPPPMYCNFLTSLNGPRCLAFQRGRGVRNFLTPFNGPHCWAFLYAKEQDAHGA